MLDLTTITTAPGIAVFTIAIIEILKTTYWLKSYKNDSWYGSLINLLALVVSLFLCLISMLLFDLRFEVGFLNGILGFFISIGGYEPFVNLIRATFFNKS